LFFIGGKMKIYSTKEFLHGLQISHPTLTRWVEEGLPCVRQNPLLFNEESVKWLEKNKPEKAELLKTFLSDVVK
jgi:predicted site-specific integrase-resolvase